MGFYRFARSISRLLPPPVRRLASNSRLADRLRSSAGHDEIYDDSYYKFMIDQTSSQSAPVMVRSLIDAVHPREVIDVGCGTGQMLLAFRDAGVDGRGMEFSQAALRICRERGLQVISFDVENEAAPPDWRADLAISTEVAEHLPVRSADRFVDLLCNLADTVFITAAVPGQRGTDHVNEQLNSYWIEKFAARGFKHDESSTSWRALWSQQGVSPWYCASAMLFRRV